jgi:hypothetical protein
MRTTSLSNAEREARLDRDADREPHHRRQRIQLTGRGALRELLLQRTDPDANAAGLWRPSDGGDS